MNILEIGKIVFAIIAVTSTIGLVGYCAYIFITAPKVLDDLRADENLRMH